ncbi:hypothetical protein UlMin_004449 [Ulmus minor]
MEFAKEDVKVTLRGISDSDEQLITNTPVTKVVKSQRGVILQLLCSSRAKEKGNPTIVEVEQLLQEYLKTWEAHLDHLRIVFDLLRAHELRVKIEKCQFGKQQVQYLGHLISNEGVAVDPSKVEGMVSWPKPKNVKGMRGFLGLTSYYRKFIQNYGNIAAPLTKMLKKNSFKWSEAAEEAFQKLKIGMTQAPVLSLPDFSKPFILEYDASRLGIGVVLLQDIPIAFFSQALQGNNLLLSTYEKEMLALILAVQKWKPYLLARKFIVRTDGVKIHKCTNRASNKVYLSTDV